MQHASNLSTLGAKKRATPQARPKGGPLNLSRTQGTPASKRSPMKQSHGRHPETVGLIPVTHTFRSPGSSTQTSFVTDHSSCGGGGGLRPSISSSDRKRFGTTTMHSFISHGKVESSPQQMRSQPATPFKATLKTTNQLKLMAASSEMDSGALNRQSPQRLLLESKVEINSTSIQRLADELKSLRASHFLEVARLKETIEGLEAKLRKTGEDRSLKIARELTARLGPSFSGKDVEERLSRLQVWRNICARQTRFGSIRDKNPRVGGPHEKTTPKNGERESTLLFTSPNELDRTVPFKFTPDSPHQTSIDAPFLVQRLDSALNMRKMQSPISDQKCKDSEVNSSPAEPFSADIPYFSLSAQQPDPVNTSNLLSPDTKLGVAPFAVSTQPSPAKCLRLTMKPSEPSEAHRGASPLPHSSTPQKMERGGVDSSPGRPPHPAIFALSSESPLARSPESQKKASSPFPEENNSPIPHQYIDLVNPLSPTDWPTNRSSQLPEAKPSPQELFSPIPASSEVVAQTKSLAIDLKASLAECGTAGGGGGGDSPTPADEAGDPEISRPSMPSHRSLTLTGRDCDPASEKMRNPTHEPKLMVALNSRSTSRTHRTIRLTHSESFSLGPPLDLKRIRPQNCSFTSHGGNSSSRASLRLESYGQGHSCPARPSYAQFLAMAPPPEGQQQALSNDQKEDEEEEESGVVPTRMRGQSGPSDLGAMVRGTLTLDDLQSDLNQQEEAKVRQPVAAAPQRKMHDPSPAHTACSSELHNSVSRFQSPQIEDQHRTTIHASVLRGPIFCHRSSISASENLTEGEDERSGSGQVETSGGTRAVSKTRKLPFLRTLEQSVTETVAGHKRSGARMLILDTSNSVQSLATQPAPVATLFSPAGGLPPRALHHSQIQCRCAPAFLNPPSRRDIDCDSSIQLLSENHFIDNDAKPSPLGSPTRAPMPSVQPCGDYCCNLAPARQRQLVTLLKDNQENEAKLLSGKGAHPQSKRFLISAAWWRRWKDYVDFDAPCESERPRMGACKTTSSMGEVIREVNKEMAKAGTYEEMLAGLKARKLEHETTMLGARLHDHPGRITNAEILKPGQSLYLRAPLLEHYDFEVVSPNLWRFLNSWYGCDWSVTRFLVRDRTNPQKFMLDLYPQSQPSLLQELGVGGNRLNRTSSLAAFSRR